VVTHGDWKTTFRPDIPSSARIYDYFLGGKDNFPADREAGDEIAGYLPVIREAAQWNRAFVGRAVRFLVNEAKITQLLDIGSGLPTKGNVHEVAHAADPDIRVVYVDHDPVVLTHARDLLAKERNAVIVKYDMREPERILADHELRHQLDFSLPVGLMFVSMLHFLPDDDDPAGIIGRLLAPFPPGSYVALTHGTADADPYVKDAAKVYDEATTQMFVRTKSKVLEMVHGMELVQPGLVWTPQWRPDPGDRVPARPSDSYYYALAARKP
jgi:SAM-dependent methyltransferase